MKTREVTGARISGFSDEQARKFASLLDTAKDIDLMRPVASPKSNWKVYRNSDPEMAYDDAFNGAIASMKLWTGHNAGNIKQEYENALSAALRAAHFAEPLYGSGKRSVIARVAHERAELEGLYLGRDFGSNISRATGRAVGLTGLVIATEDLEFGSTGVNKEDVIRESKEWMNALKMGYLIVGKVNEIYYVACIGVPTAMAGFDDGGWLLRN